MKQTIKPLAHDNGLPDDTRYFHHCTLQFQSVNELIKLIKQFVGARQDKISVRSLQKSPVQTMSFPSPLSTDRSPTTKAWRRTSEVGRTDGTPHGSAIPVFQGKDEGSRVCRRRVGLRPNRLPFHRTHPLPPTSG